MRFNNLTRLLYFLIFFIWQSDTAANINNFYYLQNSQSEAADSTGVGKSSLEGNFNPVPPTIPDNPQQSFNTNDFLDPEYKQYPLPPDVSSAMTYPVVCTPVNTSVSPIGTATFSIPIEVPQGVGATIPQLSISYNSMLGNGMVGLGCSVSGVSVITRSVRDIYHDRNAGRLSFNEYDALRLDGKRLIPKGSNIMTDGSVYVLEDDPFTEVTLHGTKADTWLEVKTSDGRTLRYGDTENSRQTVSPSSGSKFVNAWYISRMEDSNGNCMTYSYLHDNNTLYPQTVSYGKNVNTSSGADNTVNFIYENRPDKCPYIVKDVQGSMSKRLRSIETKTGDALYRHLELSYSMDPGSGASRLSRVQVWKNSDSRQKPIDITWSDSPGLAPTAVMLGVNGMDIPLTKKSDQWFLTGDINGDGVTDIVEFAKVDITTGVNKTDHSNYCIPYISSVNGDGTVSYLQKQYIDIGPSVSIGKWKVNNGLPYLSDINGDGKSDLVMAKADKKKGHTLWLRSLGTSFSLKRDVPSGRRNDSTTGYYALGDFNGDGFAEVINYGYDAWGGMGSADDPVLRTYPNNVSSTANKVQSITDGMGNCASFTYKSLVTGGLYKKRNDAEYPLLDCTVPLNVVSAVKRTNGAAGENITEYAYEGLKVHMQGKGLLGMTKTTAANQILGTAQSTEMTKWNTDYYVPQQTKVIVTTGDATETSETTEEIADKGNKALFIYPKNIRTIDADGNITEKTAEYDTANGTLTTARTSYNDGSYVQTEYGDYVKKGGRWLAQSITERRKHADDRTEYVDRTIIEYDGSGCVSGKTTHSGTPKQVKTTIWHDYYGNVSSFINEGDGINEVEYYNGYDATGRFVLKKDNDTTPASMSYTYDVFGNLLTETDDTVEDNPLTTCHSYNSWGQEIRTTTTEGAEIKTWYGWGPNLAKRYYKLTYCLGQPWQKTWYDSCGRVVMTETVADGGILSTSKKTFNNKGLETGTVQTTGKLSFSTEKEYDSRGRITSLKSSSGKNLSYSYANRQISIVDNGRTTVKEYDAQGNVRKVTDPLTTVEYRYYSNGKPSEISCSGNVVRMEYDDAGNRTLLDDPDAGRTTSVYDAEGKILSQTDGRGVKLSFSYDDWGRLSSRSGASTDIMYSYDKYDNVESVWHDGNRIVPIYDKNNRVVAENRYFSDSETQVHKYEYDKFNNITKETFPGGLSVDYTYDSYGNCTAYIIDDDTVWAERQTDGQTFKESVFSGKLTRTRVLDNSGYLKNLDLYKADKRLRGMKYKYDGATGNMTSRENVGSGVAEDFFYDELDRLVKSKVWFVAQLDTSLYHGDTKTDYYAGNFSVVSPGISIGDKRFDEWNTTKYTYSADGNIMSFPVAGNYTYSMEKPHAVIGVTNPGGKIPSNTQNINYNDINKIDEISENKSDGRHVLDFYYGPDNERWITEYQIDNEDVKSVHYGNDYEKVEERGNVREFTYLGNGLLHYRENGGHGKLLYMFTDAQGSITDIFDADGNSVFQAEYDPWGNMTVKRNDIGFIRGYTGHEMLPEFGLINMNGRMYDPQLGRFLSPDNYIQMPENSQNFNRYSYCLNNPLKYTDPSGEFLNLVFGAAIGGLFNWASHGFKYNAKGLGYFFTGAIAGVVSTGIASGVNVAMAGGSFWNGAVGMANGISSTGFLSGAAASAASGFAGGFVSGFGNSLTDGGNFERGILSGLGYGLEGGIAGGILGGVAGGIDALSKGTDFWTGKASINIEDVYSCFGCNSGNLKINENTVTGKYVGKFNGVNVYETKKFGSIVHAEKDNLYHYRAITIPERGIIAGEGVFTSGKSIGLKMMRHEYGHILQYIKVGSNLYWSVIAPESFVSATLYPSSHYKFWTETWANYLAKNYFGKAWNGGYEYPAKNINIYNMLKLKTIQLLVYHIKYY